MSNIILYGHPDSGHSYKIALALTLMGINYELRIIDLSIPRAQRDAAWQLASRFGEVPVLVTGDKNMAQSNAILLHLARENNALGWENDSDRLTEWLFWEANRIGLSLPNLRLYTLFNTDIDPAVIAWMHTRLHADLDRLDQELGQTIFLMGDRVGAADIACCAYLFFVADIGLTLDRWPALQRWLDAIKALPGWQHPFDLMVAKSANM